MDIVSENISPRRRSLPLHEHESHHECPPQFRISTDGCGIDLAFEDKGGKRVTVWFSERDTGALVFFVLTELLPLMAKNTWTKISKAANFQQNNKDAHD